MSHTSNIIDMLNEIKDRGAPVRIETTNQNPEQASKTYKINSVMPGNPHFIKVSILDGNDKERVELINVWAISRIVLE